MKHPYPLGTRIHHEDFEQSRCLSDESAEGWGIVIAVKGPYSDGSCEYKVNKDISLTGPDPEAWWWSYRIDNAYEPEEYCECRVFLATESHVCPNEEEAA